MSRVIPDQTARHSKHLAEQRRERGRVRSQALRAEIRFDREAFSNRVDELASIDLSSDVKGCGSRSRR